MNIRKVQKVLTPVGGTIEKKGRDWVLKAGLKPVTCLEEAVRLLLEQYGEETLLLFGEHEVYSLMYKGGKGTLVSVAFDMSRTHCQYTVTVFGEVHDAKTWEGMEGILTPKETQDLRNRALKVSGSLRRLEEGQNG